MNRLVTILLAMLVTCASPALAEIVVIVHPSNSSGGIDKDSIADLFLGRTRTFPNSEYALVLDAPRRSTLREEFFLALTGLGIRRIDTYWSRLMFTGQVLPPQALSSEVSAIEIVSQNRSAIAYVSKESVNGNNNVRIVASLGE